MPLQSTQTYRQTQNQNQAAAHIDPQQALHVRLAHFNHYRLSPDFIKEGWQMDLRAEYTARIEEGMFVEAERAAIQDRLADMPDEPQAFVAWFEALKQTGPGQGDRLFPWLAESATLDEMRWFLTQEAAGEAGFDDLVALSQVKVPTQAKLEMARNYWDEMGRGHERGMHGPMLANVVTDLGLEPTIEDTAWESLALANLMVAMATNRRYAYQSIGALGAIEMTAPGRVSLVNQGLIRLGAPTSARLYFQLHAGLDVEHSKAWNAEVIYSLVAADPRTAKPLAEGALMRLACGERCFKRYRAHLGLGEMLRS